MTVLFGVKSRFILQEEVSHLQAFTIFLKLR